MVSRSCSGDHEIYVAEVIGVESEGKVVVILVCRRCADVTFHEKQIASVSGPLRLLKEEHSKIEGK
jgi:hypothetical protein